MLPAALALAALVAASPADDLARARAYVTEALRYQDAITVLEPLGADPRLEPAQRIEVYRLLGQAYVAIGAPQAAETAFEQLLQLDPGHRLDPLLSPKIHAAFDAAKARVAAAPRLVEVRALPEARRVRISARLEDPAGRAARVVLHARTAAGPYRRQDMVDVEGRLEGVVLLPQLGTIRLEYHLAALDPGGAALARAGSEQAPQTLVVERATQVAQAPVDTNEETPLYQEWWLWTVVGAVVVGAAVSTAVILSPGERSLPPSTLDPITLD